MGEPSKRGRKARQDGPNRTVPDKIPSVAGRGVSAQRKNLPSTSVCDEHRSLLASDVPANPVETGPQCTVCRWERNDEGRRP